VAPGKKLRKSAKIFAILGLSTLRKKTDSSFGRRTALISQALSSTATNLIDIKMIRTAVLLISHGFQPNYEKAFTNALALRVERVTLAASVRTLFSQIDPRVLAINVLTSMDPRRSLSQKLIGKLIYIARLGKLLVSNRSSAVHVIGTFLTSSVVLGAFELLVYRIICKRLVLTVHNLLPHDQHTRTNRFAAWLAYRIPHTLVVHTERMRNELAKTWCVQFDRIIVMEHGVDDIPPSQAVSRAGDSDLHLLMFGAVAPYKGVDIALEALREIVSISFRLSIVGACRDTAYRERIRLLIDEFPEKDKIEWLDAYVEESSVQAHFEHADAVLLPYRHIDQSGVLFTAFRFGTPVIAFDVGAFAHYTNQITGVLVKNNDAGGLRDAIEHFSKNRDRFDREAVKRYAVQFLWQNTISTVLPAYQLR
jgi:glycosyltransferase involved in cell wall biosynthesis